MPWKRRSIRTHRPTPNGLWFWLVLLAGCGLDDSAVVECRCTPETAASLFPACPSIFAVVESEGREYWVTDEGDSLDAELDWVTVRGSAVHVARGSDGSPFATQIPDCPSGQRLSLLEPTRPEYALFNLRTIFQAAPQSRNLDQYMDLLTADFTFLPDEQDILLHPEVYDTASDTLWNRAQERGFAQAILGPERIGEIRFTRWYKSSTDERILAEDQLLETFKFPYEVEFVEKAGDGGEASLLAIKGWMEIDLVTPTVENAVWTIQQWRDERDPATAKRSWGELRAEFAR